MKDQQFNGPVSIFVVIALTEFSRARDSSQIYDGTAVWLFRDFLSGLVPGAVKMRLTLSSN